MGLHGLAQTLRKGDVLSAERVTEILGVREVDPLAPPPALRLAGRLEKIYRKLGTNWSVRALADGCVRVLTDEEALAFNVKRHRAGKRKISRAKHGLDGVDVHLLSPDKQQEHDNMSRVIAAHYFATRYTRLDPSEIAKKSTPQPRGMFTK